MFDQMRSLAKELEEIAAAISLVGTTRTKLNELVRWAEEIAASFRGERPLVKKARAEIIRRIHDVKVTVADQRSAQRLRALRTAIETAKNLVQKGLGDVPEAFSVEAQGTQWTVGNAWGYTESEARVSIQAAQKVLRRMKEIDLRIGAGLTFVLDPSWADGWSAIYDSNWEVIAMDPDGKGTESKGAVGTFNQTATAMGHRVWHETMKADDREAWSSAGAFALAFGLVLVGDKVSVDDAARLAVTVGKHASGWPEKVAVR